MRVVRILGVSLLAAACQRDVPVAPERPADLPTAAAPAALSAAERAALAAAITDAQAWLLPSFDAAATATIAGRFDELATSLTRADTGALTARLAAARRALDANGVEPRAEERLELAALGLVLDGIEAVIQGRLRLVPFDAAAPVAHPDAPASASELKRRTLERSLP